MSTQGKVVETQPEKKNGHKPETTLLPEQANEFAAVADLEGGVTGENGEVNLEAQSARLSDTRLLAIQRQRMAKQIGQIQGNQHLQRIIQTVAQNTGKTRVPNGHPTNGNSHKPVDIMSEAIEDENSGLGAGGAPILSGADLPPNGRGKIGNGSLPVQKQEEDVLDEQEPSEEGKVEKIEPVIKNRNEIIARDTAKGVVEVSKGASHLVEKKRLEEYTAIGGITPLPVIARTELLSNGCDNGQLFMQSGVQRTVTSPKSRGLVQLAPVDYQHSEDGSAVEQRLGIHIEEAKKKVESKDISPDKARKVDRGELARKQAELRPDAKPDIDRPVLEEGKVEHAAQKVQQNANKPPEPPVKGEEKKPSTAGIEGPSDLSAAEQAANLAEQAFTAADSQPPPDLPTMEVKPPEPVEPVDAAGMPLPGDPMGDSEIGNLAIKAQTLREGGYGLRKKAAETRANAKILQGNLQLVDQGTNQAEQGVKASTQHLQFRKGVVDQTQAALALSEQKAAFVAEKAPEVVAKAETGKTESTPLASEAKAKAAESTTKTSNDPEAAGKAKEQSQKMNRVGEDSVTVDQTISQSKDKADSLAQDASNATAMNSGTRSKIATMQVNLAQTQDRLAQMDAQNFQARSQMESLKDQPEQMLAQSEELDQQGLMLIQASAQMETQLRQLQDDYGQGMRSVPAQETPAIKSTASVEGAEATGGEGMIQRSVEVAGYEDREKVNLAEALPSWVTGESSPSQEAREAARRETEDRRRKQLAQINDEAGGHFEALSGGKKLWLGLRLTGQNLFASARSINWPNFGKTLLRGLIDPRVSLMGVVSGESMMLSGAANLFSGEHWSKDPIGNALKSAADIVTGLTIVLGSITLLAAVIAAIMGAIILLSLGTAAPVAGPILAFAADVMVIVGGWTIAVGKIALILQALTFLKNLYDAATAKTAESMQSNSEQLADDITNTGTVLITMGGAKLAQIGGRGMLEGMAEAGGSVPYAQAMPSAFAAQARSVGEAVAAAPGRLYRGARILAQTRLGPKSIVIDSNAAIALNKYFLDPSSLQPGERAVVQRLLAMKDVELRVADVTVGEVKGGNLNWKGVPITVSRGSQAYQRVLEALVKENVGRAKGVADRMIVADTFFAAKEPGVIPVFATHDPGIYNPMARIAGINPAKLGVTVPQAFPNGFEVTIEGMTIRILPLPRQ